MRADARSRDVVQARDDGGSRPQPAILRRLACHPADDLGAADHLRQRLAQRLQAVEAQRRLAVNLRGDVGEGCAGLRRVGRDHAHQLEPQPVLGGEHGADLREARRLAVAQMRKQRGGRGQSNKGRRHARSRRGLLCRRPGGPRRRRPRGSRRRFHAASRPCRARHGGARALPERCGGARPPAAPRSRRTRPLSLRSLRCRSPRDRPRELLPDAASGP